MAKKNKLPKIKDSNCLNCGFLFSGEEKFCPECGQKNKDNKLTFGSFLKEIFNGLFTWDAKFWKTLFPILLKPGKVSKDYIEGKRQRYANPFRFYLTASIVFFLILAISQTYIEFNSLKNGEQIETADNLEDNWIQFNQNEEIESLNNSVKRKDSLTLKDSLPKKKKRSYLTIAGDTINIEKLLTFQKKHPKLGADSALDSLKIEKTFSNRFWYTRARVINSLTTNKGEGKKLSKQILSYASIALFILLPIFTLFLKLLYIRRKYTYVEHLIFVFHVQTVFFLLLSIFYLLSFISNTKYTVFIFLVLFLIYLFMAMKRFYQQGKGKTFIKFLLVNMIYFFLALIGSTAISLFAFAVY